MIRQDCIYYDYEVIEDVVGIDFDRNPIYGIIEQRDVCKKYWNQPLCKNCHHYKERKIEKQQESNTPF